LHQSIGLTKPVAVALDIAGRPDTSDEYALSSVRKAYRLLNGRTFQDLVDSQDNMPQQTSEWMDWSEAYRSELERNATLARELEALRSELVEKHVRPSPPKDQPVAKPPLATGSVGERSERIQRTRAQIIALLRDGDQSVHDLSRMTNIHLRTLQRRLREMVADGLVRQMIDGVTPVYVLNQI
jgi:hypothetical protein